MEYFVSYSGTLFKNLFVKQKEEFFGRCAKLKNFFFYFDSLSTVTVQD